jgi:hypothetical protein
MDGYSQEHINLFQLDLPANDLSDLKIGPFGERSEPKHDFFPQKNSVLYKNLFWDSISEKINL